MESTTAGFINFSSTLPALIYDLIENGLVTCNELRMLELLHQAKGIVFPESFRWIPERAGPYACARRRHDEQMNQLDQRFYRCPDSLTAKRKACARQKGLVSAKTEDRQVGS
jgi:hypothetical protein